MKVELKIEIISEKQKNNIKCYLGSTKRSRWVN